MLAPLYHYCITRTDVPFGVQAAQLLHAAGESAIAGGTLPKGTHAVALGAKDEAALYELASRLEEAGIPFVRIHEPDSPFHGEFMAIGCSPVQRTPQLRQIFRKFRLLGGAQ